MNAVITEVSRKFPYCPGCGAHASFLAAGGVR